MGRRLGHPGFHPDGVGPGMLEDIGEYFLQDPEDVKDGLGGEHFDRGEVADLPVERDPTFFETPFEPVPQPAQDRQQIVFVRLQGVHHEAQFIHALAEDRRHFHGGQLPLFEEDDTGRQLGPHPVVDFPHDPLTLLQGGLFPLHPLQPGEAPLQFGMFDRHALLQFAVEPFHFPEGTDKPVDQHPADDEKEQGGPELHQMEMLVRESIGMDHPVMDPQEEIHNPHESQ